MILQPDTTPTPSPTSGEVVSPRVDTALVIATGDTHVLVYTVTSVAKLSETVIDPTSSTSRLTTSIGSTAHRTQARSTAVNPLQTTIVSSMAPTPQSTAGHKPWITSMSSTSSKVAPFSQNIVIEDGSLPVTPLGPVDTVSEVRHTI